MRQPPRNVHRGDHEAAEFLADRVGDPLRGLRAVADREQTLDRVLDVRLHGHDREGEVAARFENHAIVDNGEGGTIANCDMISWLVPADEEGFLNPFTATYTPLQDLVDMQPDDFIAWLAGMGYEPALFAYVKGNIQVR